ncbi:MAG TPA: hypothetical protein VGM94_17790 [Galbitalea sp.]
MRAWFDGLSGPAVFCYYLLAFGVLFGLVSRHGLQLGLVAGLLFAAFMTPVTLNSRRKLGGAPLLRQVSLATSKAVLPGLIDPHKWLAVLTHRRTSLRRQQLIAGILFPLVGVVAILVSLEPRADLLESIGLAALSCAAFVIGVIPPFWEIARIDKLRLLIRRDYGLVDAQDARQT